MSEPNSDPSPVSGYSFPYGIPLVFYPIMFYLAWRGLGRWWEWVFHGLFLVSAGAFAWLALSRSQYEKIHAQDQTLNRLTWFLNYLIFFVIVPIAVWFVLFGILLLGL